jgi:hypothetical protein
VHRAADTGKPATRVAKQAAGGGAQ